MAQDKTKLTFNPATGTLDLVQDVSDLVEQSDLANYIETSEKGSPNGVAELDAGGKVPATQLPNSIMEYKGNWDASSNTPTLADGIGDSGDVYRVSVAGTQDLGSGPITFNIGDFVIYSGTIWEKSINSNEVVSVNGYTGVVDLDTDDVDEGATNLYFTDSRAQTALAADLANKQDVITGTNNEVVYKNDIGLVETFQGLTKETSTGGLQLSLGLEPDNNVGNFQIKPSYINFNSLQDSPDDSYTLLNNQVNHTGNGFNFGTNGDTFTFLNNNFVANDQGDLGRITMINSGFNIGDGLTATNIKGISYANGFGNFNAEVTITDFIQGYGFQPNVDVDANLGSSAYIQAFYDGANIDTPVNSYQVFNASPNLAAINNNNGFTGLNINANINEFLGNAGYVGIGLYGNLGNFGTGGYTGVNINPTISGVQYANGISVSMDNVTVYPGTPASLVIQDLTIAADLPSSQGNTVTIEYTSGGTAGSEIVSSSGLAFEVQIEDGVSTAQQIHDALNAYLPFTQNLNVTISGTASNPQTIQIPTNLTGGTDPGSKKAAYLDGDVEITGNLTFGGALSIGKLNAFAQQELEDGAGNPVSIHQLISMPFIGDNETITLADTLGVNTAMLLNIGANSTVTTGFIGMAALALPAVINMDSGSSIDRVSGATFALSLDASAGGGDIDILDLCRAVVIPNGATTVDKLVGYKFDLPFGDPGTTSWGFYESAGVNNYLAGNLLVGGTAYTTDTVSNSSVGIELNSTTKALLPSRMTTTQRDALTALAGMTVYNTDDQMMQWYDGTVWVDATGSAVVWGGITGTLSDQTDLQTALNGKQNTLGFTPEDVANKSTSTSLGTSNTLYPSQNAVKVYTDTVAATKLNASLNNPTGSGITFPTSESLRSFQINSIGNVMAPYSMPSGNVVLHHINPVGILGGNVGIHTAGTSTAFAQLVGSLFLETGNRVNDTGQVLIKTGNSTGGTSSGAVNIQTGTGTGSINSGNINLTTGTVASGTRGKVNITANTVDVNSTRIINVATPTSGNDATNKTYVDTLVDVIEVERNADYFSNSPTVDVWDIPDNTFSITLSPGRYKMQFVALLAAIGTPITGNQICIEIQLGTNTTAGTDLVGKLFTTHLAAYASNNFDFDPINADMGVLTVTSTTTYYVNMRYRSFSGTPTINDFGAYSNNPGPGQNPRIIANKIGF